MMTSLCFFVQLADRTLILSKGSFSVYIIATRLLLNHSPSEWFSYTKKAAQRGAAKRAVKPPPRPYASSSRSYRRLKICQRHSMHISTASAAKIAPCPHIGRNQMVTAKGTPKAAQPSSSV